ncbi:MAG TPA: heme exporter protein CcmB [Gammaproteobacteria bacterium]|nr:heme exporter protein CcmB [Gammaproteobacteria bacterium]
MIAVACRELLRRDLTLAYRRRGEILTPLIFFVIVTALFPLALNPTPQLLSVIAPAVVWVAALLAGLLAQSALFGHDYEDGTLEQLVLSPQPLELLVLVRVLAHWLVTGLPLVILSPLMATMLAFPAHSMWALVSGLALGTPVLSMLGAIGSSVTVGLRRSGMLLPILVLPLCVPVLVFGARGAALAAEAAPITGPLYLLGALLALSLTLGPLAVAAGLRVSMET